MPTDLVIQQVSDAGEFQVTRAQPFKTSRPVVVPSPYRWAVEGRPHSNLMVELRWYLEVFLDYPFPPETEHAERVLAALKGWGEAAFAALFGNLSGGSLFHATTAGDYKQLDLQIASDNPGVLSWPWEAMRDPRLGTALAHVCRVQRRLGEILDAPELPFQAKDRVNILLVVARPYGEKDVRYRSLARSLVELIQKRDLPASVDLLRPPTFAQLRAHLQARPGYYHILHFDGHGAYSDGGGGFSPHSLQGAEGRLVFENDDSGPEPVSASQLNDLLRDFAVPGVVLNACQSAMVGEDAGDPFSSVAASLLRSGARSVVAMAYSLYVSGAQEFLPAFYRSLFETGSIGEAARAGRQQMRAQPKRVCVRGRFELNDWLLPVVYEQSPLDLSFVGEAKSAQSTAAPVLPAEFDTNKNPYGFVGRDSALLSMERAMHRAPAGILIRGMGGVGKTTLARGFVRWLFETHGLDGEAFWFDFRDIRSAEHVLNRIGERMFGGNFALASIEDRLQALGEALKQQRSVIVWDNFESASGITGTAITPNLGEDDRRLLGCFLDALRGGATKVLITSRSEEDWLGPQRRWKLPLGGFDGEERWEYCEAILRDLGLKVDRDNKEFAELMKQLGGHPLAMRVMLPQLENRGATDISRALQGNVREVRVGSRDEASEQLFSALRFVEHGLPESLQPLLLPLSLHESYVDLNFFEDMAKRVSGSWTRTQIEQLATILGQAGLLMDRGRFVYELHPALTGYLRAYLAGNTSDDERFREWSYAFASVFAQLSDRLLLRELHEQRFLFSLHSANLYEALESAGQLGMMLEVKMLTQGLGSWAQNRRDFVEAERLFVRLAAHEDYAAVAYHRLGMLAMEQRDFEAAEHHYLKSVATSELLDDEGVAATYHELGRLAEERFDFLAAEQWYRKSLATKEKLHDEGGRAITYHQLGMVAQDRHDFVTAEQWYRKSLAISEKLGFEHDAARAYHELGVVAYERGHFAEAEQWHYKSLAIEEQLGNEHGAALTYHELGMIAQERRDLSAAEQWYRKSLAVKERLKDERGSASTYNQLGRVAEERRDFVTAEQWYLKSLAISERLAIGHFAANSYHQLGSVALKRNDFAAAEQWCLKSLATRQRLGDEYGIALTSWVLGNLREQQNRLLEAGRLYLRALTAFLGVDDPARAEAVSDEFLGLHRNASAEAQAVLAKMWAEAGL